MPGTWVAMLSTCEVPSSEPPDPTQTSQGPGRCRESTLGRALARGHVLGPGGWYTSSFQPTGCLAQPGPTVVSRLKASDPAAESRLKAPDRSEKAAGCLEVGGVAVQALPWSLHCCPRSNGTWPAPWREVSLALWPLGAGGTARAFPQEAGARGSTHVSQLAESPHGRKFPVPPSPSCCRAAAGAGVQECPASQSPFVNP